MYTRSGIKISASCSTSKFVRFFAANALFFAYFFSSSFFKCVACWYFEPIYSFRTIHSFSCCSTHINILISLLARFWFLFFVCFVLLLSCHFNSASIYIFQILFHSPWTFHECSSFVHLFIQSRVRNRNCRRETCKAFQTCQVFVVRLNGLGLRIGIECHEWRWRWKGR